MKYTIAITILDYVASAFEATARMLDTWARWCKFCPDCGRNRYYGAPCKNISPNQARSR